MSTRTRASEYVVRLKSSRRHPSQRDFVCARAKRIIVRAGRRSGKTTGVAIKAVERFLAGRRILYATPTAEQIGRFWQEVKIALAEPIDAGILAKNESMHTIERPMTDQRIRAKTAWNADTLRGDYADLLILDEWQLMDEAAWETVGAPMLLDNNGDAVFIYTPPSLHSRSVSKARDPRHAAKLFQKALEEMESARREGRMSRWEAFHFTSHANPYISAEALAEITRDMTSLAYRQEIEAEDVDEAPGALWKRATIDALRLAAAPDLDRLVVAVDPPGGATECGIVVAGKGTCRCRGKAEVHAFVLEDRSRKAPPDEWARVAVAAYRDHRADRIVGEKNFGGDMVESTIRTVDKAVSYKNVTASRGKAVRAEPVAALYEQGRVHHVGEFPELEDEMCSWVPGETRWSPNRLDAKVWALTELMLPSSGKRSGVW